MPLHADQAACLSCGAMVEQSGGYAGIRRAAVGSATALLVLGSAVGAAVAGLPHGKDVPKKEAQAQVFSPDKAIPPATADVAPGDGATDLPGADGGSKPPPIAPEKPHGSDSSSLPDVPASPGGGGGGGDSSSGSGGAPASNSKDADDGDKPKHDKPDKKPDKPSGPTLFTEGEAPLNAWVFSSSGQSDGAGATIDSNAKSSWSTSRSKIGVEVDPGPDGFGRIGVISSTPGWSLQVYFTTATDPSGYPGSDWKPVGSTNANGKDDFDLNGSARTAKHYLVWVADTDGKRVRVNEIQLMRK